MNVAQKFGVTIGQASRLLVAAVAVLNVARTLRPRQQRRRTGRRRFLPLAAAAVILLGVVLMPRLMARRRSSTPTAGVPASAGPEGVRDLEDGEVEAAPVDAPFASAAGA